MQCTIKQTWPSRSEVPRQRVCSAARSEACSDLLMISFKQRKPKQTRSWGLSCRTQWKKWLFWVHAFLRHLIIWDKRGVWECVRLRVEWCWQGTWKKWGRRGEKKGDTEISRTEINERECPVGNRAGKHKTKKPKQKNPQVGADYLVSTVLQQADIGGCGGNTKPLNTGWEPVNVILDLTSDLLRYESREDFIIQREDHFITNSISRPVGSPGCQLQRRSSFSPGSQTLQSQIMISIRGLQADGAFVYPDTEFPQTELRKSPFQ